MAHPTAASRRTVGTRHKRAHKVSALQLQMRYGGFRTVTLFLYGGARRQVNTKRGEHSDRCPPLIRLALYIRKNIFIVLLADALLVASYAVSNITFNNYDTSVCLLSRCCCGFLVFHYICSTDPIAKLRKCVFHSTNSLTGNDSAVISNIINT